MRRPGGRRHDDEQWSEPRQGEREFVVKVMVMVLVGGDDGGFGGDGGFGDESWW